MPNVVPKATFRSATSPLLYRSYGQKFAWRAHREQLQPKQQPTITSEDGTKTLRLRPNKCANQTTLPLPPVMDPIAITARQRYREPKAREPKEWEDMSAFEKALSVNPFAQALATPVRNCTVTRACLPSFFLQPHAGHFRVEGKRIKAHVGPYSRESDKAGDIGADNSPVSFVKSKTYVMNSQDVIRAIGRKKRNLPMIVTKRMHDAYEARVRALSAQTGGSAKRMDDWIWLGSEEKSKSMLVNDVVEAFEMHAKEDTNSNDLVPMSKMEQVDFVITSHPSAPSALDEADKDVAIAAYDLSSLGLTEKLDGLDLSSELLKSLSLVAILQNRRTLKLHSALLRLALFLGKQRACHWIVVGRKDWGHFGLQEHYVCPHVHSSATGSGGRLDSNK